MLESQFIIAGESTVSAGVQRERGRLCFPTLTDLVQGMKSPAGAYAGQPERLSEWALLFTRT